MKKITLFNPHDMYYVSVKINGKQVRKSVELMGSTARFVRNNKEVTISPVPFKGAKKWTVDSNPYSWLDYVSIKSLNGRSYEFCSSAIRALRLVKLSKLPHVYVKLGK